MLQPWVVGQRGMVLALELVDHKKSIRSVFPGRGTRGRSRLCFNLSKNSGKFLSSLLHKEEASTIKLAKKAQAGSSDPVQ